MRLFGICPRITKKSGRVIAETAWRVRFLFLGTLYRNVVIDPENETISIFSRYLWVMRRRRTVPFSKVRAVTYGYEDMSTGAVLSYAHDSFDWFTVGLRFTDDSEIRLFNFFGDGTFSNNGPFPSWLYWDKFAFDLSGSQEKESRLFVDVVSKIIGVKVVPPRKF